MNSWEESAASVMARFINLSARPDEQAWGMVAIGATRLLNRKYAKKAQCTWKQNEDGNWNTTCKNIFILMEGTPEENEMRFCCYCGRVIRLTQPKERSR